MFRWICVTFISLVTGQEDDASLALDDECSFGSACALNVLQRRGLSRIEENSSAAMSDSDCLRENFYWKQPDGTYTLHGHAKTYEHSKFACQKRCSTTSGCLHFSFWHDYGCLLTGNAKALYHTGVVSGPPECTPSAVSPASASAATPEASLSLTPEQASSGPGPSKKVEDLYKADVFGALPIGESSLSYNPPNAEYLKPATDEFGRPNLKHCQTATRGDACYTAVVWARDQGIWANPQNYPELHAGASSFEEFQAHVHLVEPKTCPQPCLLKYESYTSPSFKQENYRIFKGVSYGAAPLKSMKSHLLNDDFMSDITGAMWADWGRGDMELIKSLGANMMRMYGNDANTSHRSFLDSAMTKGIDVVMGMSDFGFIQGPDNCLLHKYYCYDEAYFYYHKNLLMGMTIDNFTKFHPAFKAMIIANEPDLKVQPRSLTCRAMASMFDAMLQAEKDIGVTGNPIAYTITWSFAKFAEPAPALGQMEEFWKCLQEGTHHPPTLYTPKNDLVTAFRTRFVNSFNTANKAPQVKQLFMDKYKHSSFWNDRIRIPVFIGEYHSVRDGMYEDLTEMINYAKSPQYPFFMGYSFFEFSRRYDKGGPEMAFGMFGYGECVLMDMNYTGQVYTIWDLIPMNDIKGYPLSQALKAAYGTGRVLPDLSHSHLPCQLGTMGVP